MGHSSHAGVSIVITGVVSYVEESPITALWFYEQDRISTGLQPHKGVETIGVGSGRVNDHTGRIFEEHWVVFQSGFSRILLAVGIGINPYKVTNTGKRPQGTRTLGCTAREISNGYGICSGNQVTNGGACCAVAPRVGEGSSTAINIYGKLAVVPGRRLLIYHHITGELGEFAQNDASGYIRTSVSIRNGNGV